MSRLSKDQDTLDTEVAMIAFQLMASARSDFLRVHLRLLLKLMLFSCYSSVLGTAGLIFYTFPYLGIAFAPLSIMYYGAALFYRRSSVETKRLDSLMRSSLYASYSGKCLLQQTYISFSHVLFRNVVGFEYRAWVRRAGTSTKHLVIDASLLMWIKGSFHQSC